MPYMAPVCTAGVSFQCTPSVVDQCMHVNNYIYKVTLCALWWVGSEDGVADSPSTAGSAADDCCAGTVAPAAAAAAAA